LKTIKLRCAHCGENFERREAEVRRKTRLSPHEQCCSITCANKRRSKAEIPAKIYVRKLLGDSRRNTNGKKVGFDLTDEYLQDLWVKQEGRCAYTGVKFDMSRSTVRSMAAPSLDRIDSSIGYIPGNVQFVCNAINRMKHTRSHEEVVEFVRLIQSVEVDDGNEARS